MLRALLLNPYLLVACGGAAGSVARFAIAQAIDQRWASAFPVGTMAVNITGSFLIGLLAGLLDHKGAQQLLMVGVLGGYTTFSSFSLQSVRLVQDGRWDYAALYVLGSVALCLLGTFLGQGLATLVTPARAAP
jgi:CrcB protein